MPHCSPFPNVRRLKIVVVVLLCAGMGLSCSGPREGREEEPSEPPARVYQVQVLMTEDKAEAVQVRKQAESWWRNQSGAERPPLVQGTESSVRSVSIEWKTPFYRVRLGPFAERSQAESVLEAARSTFPDAFVAPVSVDAQ